MIALWVVLAAGVGALAGIALLAMGLSAERSDPGKARAMVASILERHALDVRVSILEGSWERTVAPELKGNAAVLRAATFKAPSSPWLSPETQALLAVWQAVEGLTPPQAARVLNHVFARFVAEPVAAEQKAEAAADKQEAQKERLATAMRGTGNGKLH